MLDEGRVRREMGQLRVRWWREAVYQVAQGHSEATKEACMNIYIVTSGCYSDYDIDAVFSTRELAQQYIGPEPQDESYGQRIEVYPLDIPIEKRTVTTVSMKYNGDVISIHQQENMGTTGFEEFWGPDYPILEWSVRTDEEERAVKVVNEKRMQILALNLWGNTEAVKQLFKGEYL